MSVRQGGWASVDSVEARRSLVDKTRTALVVLCLQVVLFQVIAAVEIPNDVDAWVGTPSLRVMDIGALYLVFAGLYLALGVAVGLDLPHSRAFGYVLCAVTVAFWVAPVAAFIAGTTSLTRSGWFLVVSLLDGLGIVLGLLLLRRTVRSAPLPQAG